MARSARASAELAGSDGVAVAKELVAAAVTAKASRQVVAALGSALWSRRTASPSDAGLPEEELLAQRVAAMLPAMALREKGQRPSGATVAARNLGCHGFVGEENALARLQAALHSPQAAQRGRRRKNAANGIDDMKKALADGPSHGEHDEVAVGCPPGDLVTHEPEQEDAACGLFSLYAAEVEDAMARKTLQKSKSVG